MLPHFGAASVWTQRWSRLTKKKAAQKKTTKSTPKSSKSTKGGGSSSRSTTKKTSKKTSKKTPSKPVKKSTTKKVSKKVSKKIVKKVAKKTAKKVTKKTVKKSSTKKAAPKTSKPKVTKKVTKKAPPPKAPAKVVKKTTKKVVKKVSKKPAPKKASPSKAPSKTAKKPIAQPAKKTETTKVDPKNADPKKPEGNKPPMRRRRPSKVKKPLILPDRPLLLGPNGPALKPLIPSGSKVKKTKSVLDNVTSRRTKTPLTKTQLEHYRHILLVKRSELMGDMRQLEEEAVRGEAGEANTSVHVDEQGSESYEQSLNLNLAASDRELIHEIDDALKRINDRTYGLCELTHEPIKKLRLDELPWARYTIAAARELDRRGGKF
jgi:RNA polymerase-binding transcription factor DksA